MENRYKKIVLVLITIVIFVLMFISFGGRERITFIESKLGSLMLPIQKTLTSIGNFVDEKTEPILNVLNYKSLNENLSKENEMLKEQVVSLTMNQKELTELEDLKQALQYVDSIDAVGYVSCNVIAKDMGNWFNMFTIDAGSIQGITKNSTVINGKGLVGLVYEVGENWSKVISIVDQKSSVGFEMLRVDNDFDGILSGTTNYELIGELFDPKASVSVGDYIVTSGLGMYPKGIMIGQVYEVNTDKDLILNKIKVTPVVDFKKINKVMVIPYIEKDETVKEIVTEPSTESTSEDDQGGE